MRGEIGKNTATGLSYEKVECHREETRPGQQHVIEELKREAAKRGANAVVYAYSELAQTSTETECERLAKLNEFGGGWAVVVAD